MRGDRSEGSLRQLEPLASRNLASNGSFHQLFPSAELVSNVTDVVPFSFSPHRGERLVHQELVNQHPLDRDWSAQQVLHLAPVGTLISSEAL